MRLPNLVVLQRIADQVTAAGTQYSTDRGASPWRARRRAYDRAGSRT
jgi:hypothetical protein